MSVNEEHKDRVLMNGSNDMQSSGTFHHIYPHITYRGDYYGDFKYHRIRNAFRFFNARITFDDNPHKINPLLISKS